jgi:Protein of unknown function (DUF2490)
MKKRDFIVVGCLLFAAMTQAQTAHHTLWTKVTLAKKINKKVVSETELIYRRQDFLANDERGMLQQPLLYAVRTMLHYRPTSNWTLSALPFAYFYAYPLLSQKIDIQKDRVSEMRFLAFATHRFFYKKWEWNNRFGVEERLQKTSVQSDFNRSTRLRFQSKISHHLAPKHTISLFDELFFTFPQKNLEHNRLGIVYTYRWSEHCRSELGYMFIQRQKTNFWENEYSTMLNTYFLF